MACGCTDLGHQREDSTQQHHYSSEEIGQVGQASQAMRSPETLAGQRPGCRDASRTDVHWMRATDIRSLRLLIATCIGPMHQRAAESKLVHRSVLGKLR